MNRTVIILSQVVVAFRWISYSPEEVKGVVPYMNGKVSSQTVTVSNPWYVGLTLSVRWVMVTQLSMSVSVMS